MTSGPGNERHVTSSWPAHVECAPREPKRLEVVATAVVPSPIENGTTYSKKVRERDGA